MKRFLNFFRFQKRIWVSFLICVLAGICREFLVPFLPMFMQLGFAVALQAIQVVSYFYIFFVYLSSRASIQWFKPGDLDLDWSDYRGNPIIVEKARAMVSFLRGDDNYEKMGGELEPGTILVGEPGVGKTWLAKVLASVAGVPLVAIDCQSLKGTFVGIGPLKVRSTIRKIKNKAIETCQGIIVVFDEIDGIAEARAGVMGSQDREWYWPWQCGFWMRKPFSAMPYLGGMGSQILTTLLSEIDGMSKTGTRTSRMWKRLLIWLFGSKVKDWRIYPHAEVPRVIFFATTNRPEVLDPALARAGRFGRMEFIDLPHLDGMKDVATYFLNEHRHPSGVRGILHDHTLTANVIAQTMLGKTPADVKYVLNDAIKVACRRDGSAVNIYDFMDAFAERMMGSRNPLPLDLEQKLLLAAHEAMHATVMIHLAGHRIRPAFVTIERYGRSLGHVLPVEVFAWYLGRTQDMLETSLKVLLAGAAGEVVLSGERHNSMGGDLPGCWSILKQLAYNGMLGEFPIEPEDKRMNRLMRKKLASAWDEAIELGHELHKPALALAHKLVEKPTLTWPEVERVLAPYNVIRTEE